jgi:cytochrome c oxidase subunit 4
MSEHIVSRRVYFLIFVTLILLTLVTIDVSFYNWGILNFPLAMTIASIKAMLVILFFMHVKYSTGLTGVFVAAGFIFLAIMLTFSLADLLSRDWQYQPDSAGFSLMIPLL